MDAVQMGKVKVNKTKKSGKYSQLRKLSSMFKLVEVCVVLILVSRISIQLFLFVKNSGQYFRDITAVLGSSRFVFVLGNVIVIILFAISGQFSGKGSSREADLYNEFVAKREMNRNAQIYTLDCQDKKAKYEESKLAKDVRTIAKIRPHQRSQSENLRHVVHEHVMKPDLTLSRSLTEICGKELSKSSFPEDSMSSEEFRMTVEAFIARQQRFLREEEYAVM